MAPTAGTVDTITFTLAVYGADTAATITARNPSTGAVVPLTPVADADKRVWTAEVEYTVPGNWVATIVVTGTGATGPGGRSKVIPVGPALAGDAGDPRHTYATTTQLADYLHEAPPADADELLRRASAKVDEALTFANYDTDADGMPTDVDDKRAIMLATCAVVKWWESIGEDGTGATSLLTNASIAGVNLGWKRSGPTSKTGDGGPDLVGDEARQHLREQGLLGGGGPWY
jgi:hypothetical protein